MIFNATCVIVSLIVYWGVRWFTLMIRNLSSSGTSWQLVFKCAYEYLGMSRFDSGMRCSLILHSGLTSRLKAYTVDTWHQYAQECLSSCLLKRKHVTLGICILNNTFPCIVNHKTIISSTQMCFSRCHNNVRNAIEFVFVPTKSNGFLGHYST